MANNRKAAFVRHVMNRVAGLQYYTPHEKAVEFEGDTLRFILDPRAASNKATMIEFTPAPDGQVNVTFLNGDRDEPTVVSQHTGIFYDALAELLFRELEILVGGPEKDGENAGRYRTSGY